jgi:hypothetical protein
MCTYASHIRNFRGYWRVGRFRNESSKEKRGSVRGRSSDVAMSQDDLRYNISKSSPSLHVHVSLSVFLPSGRSLWTLSLELDPVSTSGDRRSCSAEEFAACPCCIRFLI